MERGRLSDKGVRTDILKKFWSSFFKSLRSGGRVALLARRNGRNIFTAFLFASFFFAPLSCKEKATNKFIHFNELFFGNKGLSVICAPSPWRGGGFYLKTELLFEMFFDTTMGFILPKEDFHAHRRTSRCRF